MPKNKIRENISLPIGTIVPFTDGNSVPPNYVLCDGSAVSRSTFAALFAIVGTQWGEGDGSTTFHLPDLRGRFLRGRDAGSGSDPEAGSRTSSNTGGNTGDLVGSYQGDQFQSHTHPQNRGSYSGPVNDNPAGWEADFEAGSVTGFTGGNETRPKNVYVNFIIKVV
jgi:microcystin-dependent protein